jgi:hemolysin activation/secretion protein
MTIHSKTRFCGASLAVVLAAGQLASPSGVFAQAIERNLPPAPQPATPLIAPANLIPSDQDATPIGAVLKGVVILGANDPALSEPTTTGVDVSRAARLNGDAGHLAGFLGQPISRKLIAQIEAEIANRYRHAGFPFVNLATPPQEITSGVLQIRVLEFRLAQKTAPGAEANDALYIESRVRAEPGQPIDTNRLAQDLDWLNRFPFRKTEAMFTPATTLGGTDLALQTTPSKPWSAYVGYSDSGSPRTGMDRYFTGFQALLPNTRDILVSYQFTGSNDELFDGGRLFNTSPDPAYVSHAGRLIIPTLARQDIEASVSYVQSTEPAQDFLVRQTTYEGTLAYRSALSDIWSVLPGEGVIGVEAKRQTSRTLFDGAVQAGSSFDVFQVTVGYAQQETDAWGRTSGDITAHISPGSVNDQNTAAAFASFSQGRFDEARYAYLSFDLNRYTLLPPVFGLAGFSLSNTLIGQYSAVALPLTEQIGLGNNSLVRGYTLDDGAFDAGVLSRNELRAPSFALLGRTGRVSDQLSPYVFLDAGYGKDRSTKIDAAPISTGLGADYQLTTHLTATLDGAWALRSVGYTRSGDARLESRVTFSF